MNKVHDRALGVAEQMRRYAAQGQIVLAEQAARTIDELVGCYIDGRLVWPDSIRRAAGLTPVRLAREAGAS